MELDREKLALASHKMHCLKADCPKDGSVVDQADRDHADNINDVLVHYEDDK